MKSAALLMALMLSGCAPPALPPLPAHYVVGEPYQALGAWRYPREQFAGVETSLATIAGAHGPLATDGERFDQTALTAAHPTLQLPALARVANLESGREITVRVNDRGPLPASRAIALTRRAAELIGARDGTRVRVRVLENESRQLASELRGDAGKLAIATAPKADVLAEPLPPPPGIGQGRARFALVRAVAKQAAPAPAAPPIPLRLPEQVAQVPPQPGSLYIVAGSFGRLEYAEIERRRIGGLGARIATLDGSPRERAYRVEIGPIDGVAQADATLGRALAAGVSDARIVVQ